MLTSSSNQYIRPEYLSPLPTTLDAKKSPLALLAQTCSQIGADSATPSRPLVPPSDKGRPAKADHSRDKCSPSSTASSSSPGVARSSFKPYENCVKEAASKTPKVTPAPVAPRSASNQSASSPRASPVQRKTPASQELAANTKEGASSKTQPYGYPPLDLGLNPYLQSYARLKAASDPPLCRDPYCTGCQLSSHLLSPGKPCPAGCTQCDKAAAFLPSPHHSAVAAAYAHAQLAALAAASQLPYVCSWIAGDATYCGKRFSNSEELLHHLRTHTSDSLLSPPSSHPLLHRTYPTPPLSPLATARYHPYSKPTILPPSLLPFHQHPGLPPYFSPYSLYGPRLGASSGMHP